MGFLKSKERTTQEEAERQSRILTEIEFQKQKRAADARDQMAANAAAARQEWADQEQLREQRRMEEMARPQRERLEREERQRAAEAESNRLKMEAYRLAKAEVETIDRASAQLNVPHDLSTIEGVLSAAEVQARVIGLHELRERADRRLIEAERAIGRHRNGGW